MGSKEVSGPPQTSALWPQPGPVPSRPKSLVQALKFFFSQILFTQALTLCSLMITPSPVWLEKLRHRWTWPVLSMCRYVDSHDLHSVWLLSIHALNATHPSLHKHLFTVSLHVNQASCGCRQDPDSSWLLRETTQYLGVARPMASNSATESSSKQADTRHATEETQLPCLFWLLPLPLTNCSSQKTLWSLS